MRSMTRGVLAIGVSACVVSMIAAPAAARAALHAPAGGGYVATPKTVRSATMLVRVPTLPCAHTARYAVSTGLFGFVVQGSRQVPWSLAVAASCARGVTSYRAVTSGPGGPAALLRVHPGDRVRLVQSGPYEYEVEDVTTGEGSGGGGGGPGATPSLRTTMLFGAKVTGTVPAAVHVTVSQTRINGTPVRKASHHAQRQSSNGRTVAYGRDLLETGGFTVAVPRTPVG